MERVLVVEDDLSIRESLSTALDLEGFDVRAVPSAESALALLDSEIPDIALLDVRLPRS
jgi:DNA-binding response OmpR family regulator